MIPISKEMIGGLLPGLRSEKLSSDLGFFSKPFRIFYEERAYIIKMYLPVVNYRFISAIISNHDAYVSRLRSAGLLIPDTMIFSRQNGRKHQLIIVQESFLDDELLRTRIQEAGLDEMKNLCCMVFDDILRFRRSTNGAAEIGFHPTLRNYALHSGALWFFDTFPPMLMSQKDLNSVILKMSPFGGILKAPFPSVLMNLVSDEYYQLDKMFTGIVGSCCRLRPDDTEIILGISRNYVSGSAILSEKEKSGILLRLNKPPHLPPVWIFIRRLSGNTGMPNIRAS